MSAWRRNALILFPERRREFATAPSVKSVLAALQNDFLQASGSGADELGSRLCAYISRCLKARRDRAFERQIIHQYLVHWGAEPRLRLLLFKCLSPKRFLEETRIFEERLERADFQTLWTQYVYTIVKGG